MRKTLLILLLAAVPVFAFAQKSKMPQRNTLVEVVIDDESIPSEYLDVFNAPVDGENHYFISVGHLGYGDEVVQLLFDPVFELFIPLGDNLSDALETLQKMQDLFKQDPGTSLETQGCLAFGFPTQEREKVTVTYRKVFLSKKLEFSVQREGYIRSSYIGKSDFGSAVRGVKFYRKIHPKE